MKRVAVEPGSIRVRSTGRGVPYPTEAGWEVIPAWSRGAAPYNALSPFKIKENNCFFENVWQSYKVWEAVEKQTADNWKWPAETHATDGAPNMAWYRWHDALRAHSRPVRRPNGRNIPLYAWFEGEQLGVVEARKRIYIPRLQKLYRAHEVYQKLLQKVRAGQNIVIVEPDGCPHGDYPQGRDVNLELLVEWQDCTTDGKRYFPYGHGYVIALTLLEDLQE